MAFTLPALSYAYNALEPHIDARTMEIHHTKHHQAYINNANKALEAHAHLASRTVEELLAKINEAPDGVRQTLINNAGGHANHSLFWQVMGSGRGGEPKGALADAIKSTFGGFDKFKETFANAAATRFGSGWAWLALKGGKLEVFSTANQDSPIMTGHKPLLGLDVWEHAYYLNYQNRRLDYIAAFWNVVNWDEVAKRFAS
ncbi:MAG: superoxide dismutase [Phycisphaerae bacterium]|nr:superoxide dismutase [Phycisphaerae bacterium]NUQ45747.1 superoxide dismutase [Phycisphaerae bacterium]